MAARFAVRSKRTALSTRAVYRTPGPCCARQSRYVETKDHCFANPQEWVGQAGPDTGSDQDIHSRVASARSASAHRKRLRGVQILRRELQRPKFSETSALSKILPRGPYRLRSCLLIRRRSRLAWHSG